MSAPPFVRIDGGYAWVVLGISALLMGLGGIALFSIGVFLKPMAAEFGWTRGEIAFAYTLGSVLSGVGGVVMGVLADKMPLRPLVLVGMLAVGGGLLLLPGIDRLWQFYAIYGPLLGGIGMAALATPVLSNVGFWFDKHRGMALGAALAGQSVGGALGPVILRHIISIEGWRNAYQFLGVGILVLTLPLTLLIRDAPGKKQAQIKPLTPSPKTLAVSPGAYTAVLSFAIVLCCITMSIPIVHLVALATDQGIAPETGAQILGVMMVASIIGRVGIGKVADMIGGFRALLLAQGAQTVMIFWFTQMHTPAGLYVIAVLFGLGYGGVIPAYAIILREVMPDHIQGRSLGIVFLFGFIGMGLGGYLGGVLYDLTGSYTLAYLTGTLTGIAQLIVITLLYRTTQARLKLALAG